jgi:hypothetical protein
MMPVAAGAATDPAFSLQNGGSIVQSAGDSAGLGGASDVPTIVGRGINVLLGIVGIVFVVITVYAGFLYLTAQGEETNVKKAKKMLSQAVIGLVLIVGAYAITTVVVDALSAISTTPAAPAGGDSAGPDSGSEAVVT